MQEYLSSTITQFEYYKSLGEKSMNQIDEKQWFIELNSNSNSIATIVKHLHGNMLSRWTDFLESDGEKEWRNRDGEFELEKVNPKDIVIWWEEGWQCLFDALKNMNTEDLEQTVYIRNMGQKAYEAINRQVAHYAYHIGQMVFLAKALKESEWESLSIPKGNSKIYNAQKFAQGKRTEHFSQEFLNKKGEQ